ncbi:hypothetical protein GGR54DRAFT_636941 [Hypoxylon sp. NC1633]|nr:hypothetical protein GGR54DRAFT_636941 [Hypoxylon sp. NC1633]
MSGLTLTAPTIIIEAGESKSLIEIRNDGKTKALRALIFSRRSAASKEHAAEVLQSHAPKTGRRGQRPAPLKLPTRRQRDRTQFAAFPSSRDQAPQGEAHRRGHFRPLVPVPSVQSPWLSPTPHDLQRDGVDPRGTM